MIKDDASKYIKELEEINDEKERITVACEKFNKGELPAKVIRILYNKTMFDNREFFLDLLYARDTRRENMQRLPPQLLFHKNEVAYIHSMTDIDVYASLLKYYYLNLYMTSKTQDQLQKMNTILNCFTSDKLFDIYSNGNYYKNMIKHRAMELFFKELIEQNEEQDVSPLHLPSEMTMGVEIECVGAYKNELIEFRQRLRKNSIFYLEGFKIKNDGSLRDKKGKNNRIRSCK